MPFVKLVKDKAYHKRYQVKYRRRRDGKTDYYARKRLTTQAKNKYQSPKYRFVVRFSNRFVTCQIIHATLKGDRVICSAYSKELSRYGLSVGLKNYPAAYCTGLLLARRLMHKLDAGKEVKLSDLYVGSVEVDGEVNKCEGFETGQTFYVKEEGLDEEHRPFRANLDVGLRPTTLGARVFGALKGASDGGLDIPHNEKRFPGYDPEEKSYDAEEHKEKIMGGCVAEYMRMLIDENEEDFRKVFSSWIAAGHSNPDEIEDLYASVHAAIRADPSPAAKKALDKTVAKPRRKKLTNSQRKGTVAQKLAYAAFKDQE